MARPKTTRTKEEIKSFSINFPKSVVEEIDLICAKEYITRTSWLLRAARELLNKERLKKTEDLIAKMSEDYER
jgi:metal-responsive CopG/Arc/MetJ family transcriptional regulator